MFTTPSDAWLTSLVQAGCRQLRNPAVRVHHLGHRLRAPLLRALMTASTIIALVAMPIAEVSTHPFIGDRRAHRRGSHDPALRELGYVITTSRARAIFTHAQARWPLVLEGLPPVALLLSVPV
jgi:hypothetical protein